MNNLDLKKKDLRKDILIFEAKKTENFKYSFKLTNSSILTKNKKVKEVKFKKIVNSKGRNGELLYFSNYKKLSTILSERNQNNQLFEIRNQNGNLELDKSSYICSYTFAAGLVKTCAKL